MNITSVNFCIFRTELDRELEKYENEQRSTGKNVEAFSLLTSEQVYLVCIDLCLSTVNAVV